ncbi:hypothetical protein Q673_18030 [Marinobacter sp. EN3]|uniref:Restriction endonuclease subunit S n=1 Tax=Marinobacter vinifirmus TaxID=355591 RepID=A0A558B9D9_9GAMM|nr:MULTISPECIES: restriction endonuclease subunit S [Marinobacter]ERS06313.1 hypothetical protein Q673_18030 [Marinobacter sp. EN3]TVT33135.1 MAG: restriction endonuclease subunit S [Marinobacter vinifirmus]
MSSEWVKMRLGDFIDLKRGYDLPKKSRSAGPIPLVSSAGVSDQHSEAKVRGPGVVTGRYGTIGDVFYIEEDFWPLNTTLYVRDFKGNDPRFTYYFLKTIDYLQYSDKAAVPGVNRNHLHMAEISVPKSVDEQRRIASVLSCLDDKIEANDTINQTLEQMAQAIFKSWFVDFEPVKAKIAALEAGGSEEDALLAAMQAISGKSEAELTRLQAEHPEQYAELRATAELFPSAMQDSELGEIPEGWGVDHLSELVQFNPRRSLKKGTLAPYLDMKNVPTSGHLAEDVVLREMNSGTKFVNGDTLLARITPCLENGKTAYVDFLDSDQVGWGSTEYIVMRSQEPYPESMSYFIARDGNFRQHAIQSMTGTSGRQRANAKALAELPWLIYPRRLTEEFDRIAAPYLKLAKSHGNQSKSLSAIRDSLLPKLLSGELDTTKVGA